MNEPQNQEKKASHFLTLHISHKGQQKTLHFRIRHAAAVCAAAAVLVGGAVVSVGAYQKTRADLQASEEQLLETERTNRKLAQRAEALQNENNEYNENIDAIQSKTSELEQKMNELETVKEDLYDQINTLTDTEDTTASPSLAMSLSAENSVTFTNIVTTAYHRTSDLSAQLDKMSAQLDEAGLSFTTVAEDVTYTLASRNNIPSGWPVESRLVSTEFNPTADPSISDGRKHCGMDISTNSQIIPIYATAAGTVLSAEYRSDYGYCVTIDHYNGFTTLYAHCDSLSVSAGDKVKKGDVVGMTGTTGMSTGIHCHYEIQLNGIYQDPRDYLE